MTVVVMVNETKCISDGKQYSSKYKRIWKISRFFQTLLSSCNRYAAINGFRSEDNESERNRQGDGKANVFYGWKVFNV